ncbi:zinc finger protein 33A-like [Cloeon dipterum]|uniref:zinc finger protein 33A-like n=1 Tax=Cloeon dipterum TaxID=197152 RepID=UPI0032205FF8
MDRTNKLLGDGDEDPEFGTRPNDFDCRFAARPSSNLKKNSKHPLAQGNSNVTSTSNLNVSDHRKTSTFVAERDRPSLDVIKRAALHAEKPTVEKETKKAFANTLDVSKMYQNLLKMKEWTVKFTLIYNPTEKNCKMCQIPILDDSEVMEHFMIHFTPCCSSCATGKCVSHSVPLFQHKENYYQDFTQHKLTLFNEIDGAIYKCSSCEISFRKCAEIPIDTFYHFCPLDKCPRSFTCMEELVVHVLGHLASKVCETCRTVLLPSSNIQQHIAKHMLSFEFECESCGAQISDENLLIKHLRGCTKNVVQRFRNAVKKSLAAENQLLDVFVKKEQCLQCSVEMMSKQSLNIHVSNHPLLLCPLCSAPVDSLMSHCLNAHKKIFSLQATDVRTVTAFKEAIKYKNDDLINSVKNMYTSATDSFKDFVLKRVFVNAEHKSVTSCFVCSMKFENDLRQEIDAHFRVHLTPCCLSCNINQSIYCDVHKSVLFLHRENYFVNMSCHKLHKSTDGQSFRCKNCTIVFGSPHEKKLIKSLYQKFHQCDECSLDTLSEDKVAIHILVHMAKKVCVYCPFYTTSSTLASEHVALHRGAMTCVHCKLTFHSEDSYTEHSRCCVSGLYRYLSMEKKNTNLIKIKNLVAFCRLCSMMFDSIKSLTQHMSFHLRIGCPFCKIYPSVLELHIMNCHKSKVDLSVECSASNLQMSILKERVNKIKAHALECSSIDLSFAPQKDTPGTEGADSEGKRLGCQIFTLNVPNK